MRFAKLSITNFRSIGPGGVTIQFSSERNLAVMVGANGSGKPNILQALAILLGVSPFGGYELQDEDCFAKDTEQGIRIELHLAVWIREAG